MALIVLHGPKAIDAARAFKHGMGFPCWDLSPDIAEAVRMDVLDAQTPLDAITFVARALVNGWVDGDGWNARYQTPVEADIEGVPL